MKKRIWLVILVITLVMTGCGWNASPKDAEPQGDENKYTVYNTIKISERDINKGEGTYDNYPSLIPAELFKVKFMYVYNPALFFRPSSPDYKLAIDDDTPPIRPFLPPMRKK